jgi:hypothetical protein
MGLRLGLRRRSKKQICGSDGDTELIGGTPRLVADR